MSTNSKKFNTTGMNDNIPDEENTDDYGVYDYLTDCICRIDGQVATLPTGGECIVPNWTPEDNLAKRWMVLAPEKEDGIEYKRTGELTKSDVIVGVELNERSIKAMENTYGKQFYMIRDANGEQYTPIAWYKKFKTNGIGLMAIKGMRRKMGGKSK